MARLNKTSGQAQAGGGEVVSLDEPLLDCVAAAALLNVRVSWVRDAARLGHLPCVRVGRHLRFTRVMLEDWLVVQLARPPAAGRAYAAAAASPRSNASPFRRSTQAALLASLAERPNGTAVEREG
jgi:excisionase family DNA binding protein